MTLSSGSHRDITTALRLTQYRESLVYDAFVLYSAGLDLRFAFCRVCLQLTRKIVERGRTFVNDVCEWVSEILEVY